MIQLGLTFSDADGRLPTADGEPYSTWQFNFMFDLAADLYAADSVQFLQKNGLDFDQHQQQGIDVTLFGELLMSSGVVLNDEVRWIAFQGKYDFAYLVKVLTCDHLPQRQEQFFDLLQTYFPHLYDLRWLVHLIQREGITTDDSADDPLSRGARERGLEDLANKLNVPRVGQAHQAGSDSLLTEKTFFALVRAYLPNLLNEGESEPESEPSPDKRKVGKGELANILHGLGRGFFRVEKDTVPPPVDSEPKGRPVPPVPPRQPFPPISGAIRLVVPTGRVTVQE